MTPAQLQAILRANVIAREADIVQRLEAFRTASPGWIRGAMADWQTEVERLEGYKEGMRDAVDALTAEADGVGALPDVTAAPKIETRLTTKGARRRR